MGMTHATGTVKRMSSITIEESIPDMKPCPFCKADGMIIESHHLIGDKYYAACNGDGCGATGPNKATREAALIAWNIRA